MFAYIKYVVDGEQFGVQCTKEQVQAALADITLYVGFQRIVSVEQRSYTLAASTWYPQNGIL